MGYPIEQGQTAQVLAFLMISSSDHISGAAGLSPLPTVTLSKNGAAFAAPAGAVTETGNGWYQVAGNATDANILGPLALHASATGADPKDELFSVVAYNPLATSLGLVLDKGTNLVGLNDIAATAIVTAGAISTSGGVVQSNSVQANGQPLLTTLNGQAVPAGTIPVAVYYVGNQPALTQDGILQAGTTTTGILAADSSSIDGFYAAGGGWLFTPVSGTGVGTNQPTLITAYNGTTKQAEFATAGSVAYDETTGYTLTAPVPALGSGGGDGGATIEEIQAALTESLTGGVAKLASTQVFNNTGQTTNYPTSGGGGSSGFTPPQGTVTAATTTSVSFTGMPASVSAGDFTGRLVSCLSGSNPDYRTVAGATNHTISTTSGTGTLATHTMTFASIKQLSVGDTIVVI
jgi:hypothetical protein